MKIKNLILIFLLMYVNVSAVQIKTGTYTGDGNDNRDITGVGFQPDVVITFKKNDVASYLYPVFSTADMPADVSYILGANFVAQSNHVQQFSADGFQIGNSAYVNGLGAVYHYVAIYDDGEGDFCHGVYTGNSTNNRDITSAQMSGTPILVVMGSVNSGRWKITNHATNECSRFSTYGGVDFGIDVLIVGGMRVDNYAGTNLSGTLYYWFAFKEIADIVKVGTYNGNSVDDRDITGIGFQPDVVWIGHFTGSSYWPRIKIHDSAVDFCRSFGNEVGFSNNIQAFISDGFQIGSTDYVNSTANDPYYYVCLKTGDGEAAEGIPLKKKAQAKRIW